MVEAEQAQGELELGHERGFRDDGLVASLCGEVDVLGAELDEVTRLRGAGGEPARGRVAVGVERDASARPVVVDVLARPEHVDAVRERAARLPAGRDRDERGGDVGSLRRPGCFGGQRQGHGAVVGLRAVDELGDRRVLGHALQEGTVAGRADEGDAVDGGEVVRERALGEARRDHAVEPDDRPSRGCLR